MANALYDAGRQAFLEAGIDWLNDDIRVVLIDTADYTVDLANDDFLADVPGAARVAVSPSLTSKTSAAGVADADDATFATVSGDDIEAAVIYRHTGSDATSALIAYLDTVAGFPFTPNGGNIVLQWSASGIFKL